MYQVNDDDIQDMAELHRVFEALISAAKEKYSKNIILSAMNMTMIDLIRVMATDKQHFLSCKEKFCMLVDMDAERFYG